MFFTETHPVARKPHTCGMCRRQIRPGETYRRGAGMDGGTAWTFKECAHCLPFIRLAHTLAGDSEYGEDLLIEFEPENVAEARVRAQFRRQWQNRAGDLYPVPVVIEAVDKYGFGRAVGIKPGEETS
jgi:hypothetical protein